MLHQLSTPSTDWQHYITQIRSDILFAKSKYRLVITLKCLRCPIASRRRLAQRCVTALCRVVNVSDVPLLCADVFDELKQIKLRIH